MLCTACDSCSTITTRTTCTTRTTISTFCSSTTVIRTSSAASIPINTAVPTVAAVAAISIATRKAAAFRIITTSAAKTIDRVVDVFPAEEKSMVRSMLSESLQAVISQTLMKKNGGGRVAAHEIMIGTPAIRNLIREDKVAQMYSAIQTGAGLGMQTLDQCLQGLVQKGLVSREVAREKAKNPDSI